MRLTTTSVSIPTITIPVELTAIAQSGTTPEAPSGYTAQADSPAWAQTVTLNSGNGWTTTVRGLDKADAQGNEYVYYIASVSETNVPSGTSAVIGSGAVYGNSAPGTLTVTDTLPTTRLSAHKDWAGTNPSGHPASVTFHLLADGTEVGTGLTANSGNNWTVNWDNLQYYNASGSAISYTVTEDAVEHYELTSATYANGTFTLINTFVPYTGSLQITKTVKVDNALPTDANKALTNGTYTFTIWDSTGTTQITTKADGTTAIGTLSITVTDGVASPATLTVDGLTPGTYVVKETAPTNGMMLDTTAGGYNSTLGGIVVVVSANDASGVQTAAFTNKTETESVTVSKTWATGSPSTPVTFNLYAGSSEANAAASETVIASIELDGTADDNAVTFTYGGVTANKQETAAWTAAFTGLPKYVSGVQQYYVVKEATLANYRTTYPGEQTYARDSQTITNTQDTGSVEVTKTFSGIEASQIPAGFQIEASWSTDGGTTTNTRTLKISGMESYSDVTKSESDLSYTWTISNLPIGTEVTFTESGYEIAGYNVASTVTQVASGQSTASPAAGTSGAAHASAETTLPASAKVEITNAYTPGVELPATGGPGTVLYTAAGLTLLLGASLWLMLRRRKEQQN